MNQQFEECGFLVIKNFIQSERAKKLSKEFIKFCNENPYELENGKDKMFPNTPSKHNYISFLSILYEKLYEVSNIIEHQLKTSYSYARVYKNNDILEKHVDRNACEISLSIHLDGDKEWDFFLNPFNEEEKSIILNSGDAVIYYGCKIPHWRNFYEGKYYCQLFLHYLKK